MKFNRGVWGIVCALLLVGSSWVGAQEVNTKLLSENGWYSDDTRADGSGSLAAGTNLVSPTLTDDPEATASGDPTHNSDINGQIRFGPAPGTVPVLTHDGAVRLTIDGGGSGKSQISHRKDDATGHGPGSGFGPGFSAEYSWFGDGTPTVTASLKFGIKTAEFGGTGVSPRTGENAWDKLLIYEPGNLNGGTSNGTWQTETTTHGTGLWWFFDRTASAGTIGTPMTLDAMSTSTTLVGAGPKTIQDVYNLITASGAIITSVQFGIGSGNAGGNVYVNQLVTNVYRAGLTTTFGCTDAYYANGFEVDSFGWNVFSSPTFDSIRVASGTNGVTSASGAFHAEAGTSAGNWGGYSGVCGCSGSDCAAPSAFPLGGYVTSIDIYLDVGGGFANDTRFDFSSAINTPAGVHRRDFIFNGGFYDSSDLNAPAGGVDRFVIAASNNSPGAPLIGVDPVAITSTGWYTFEHHFYDSGAGVLACDFVILDASGTELARWTRSDATDVIGSTVGGNRYGWFSTNGFPFLAIDNAERRPGSFDQNITPDVIFGSGNANGGFTVDRQDGVELGLRAKLRFPPSNIFNSNGDGTYTFNTGSGTSSPPNPEWGFEWGVNTDFDDSSGLVLADLTYELGIDFEPGAGTDFLSFDLITPSVLVPFYDHAIGDNTTVNGGGTSAGDAPTYLSLIGANNVAQNSWRMTFFDDPPFFFDPDVPGFYDFYLSASSGGTEVARTEIQVVVTDGISLTLEADPCATDADPGLAGLQVEFDLWARNPDDLALTGYQVFLSFDDVAMAYEGASSSYSPAPFDAHIQPMATAEVAAGELRLDGASFIGGTSGDAHLATLVFTVTECDANVVDFDLTQAFDSEVSIAGGPIATNLLDSPSVVADVTPPVLTCPTDVMVGSDAGLCTATVTPGLATAVDNCGTAGPVSGVRSDELPLTDPYPTGTTTITWSAEDCSGNVGTCVQTITVNATTMVSVPVELVGVNATSTITRCIQFHVFNGPSCATVVNVDVDFLGSSPATGIATFDVDCGDWTDVCVKDEQHTLYETVGLSVVGANYEAPTPATLFGGDTDNDGDIDINDVTFLIFTFGGPEAAGSCPWSDTSVRGADFSNNGNVGSEDYAILAGSWLSATACSCTAAPFTYAGPISSLPTGVDSSFQWTGANPVSSISAYSLPADLARKVDRDRNGIIDHRDVRAFELANGLPHTLSNGMKGR